MIYHSDGKLIKLKRIELDLDQKTLAQKAEVSQQQISKLEADITSGIRTYDKVWKALDDYEKEFLKEN